MKENYIIYIFYNFEAEPVHYCDIILAVLYRSTSATQVMFYSLIFNEKQPWYFGNNSTQWNEILFKPSRFNPEGARAPFD